MKHRDQDTRDLLQEALEAVREDLPSAEVERQAGERVWARLSREVGAPPALPHPVGRIRSQGDYFTMVGAYLAGELSPAKLLLFEDELRDSPALRRVVQRAREGEPFRRRPAATRRPTLGGRARLAIAASLLVAAGAAAVLVIQELAPGDAVARVAHSEGGFFRLEPAGAAPLSPGDTVGEGESLRTARGASAVLRLADGSRVELRERSQVALSEARGDTTVRVARGSVMVEAAEQGDGHLYVATDDCLVEVTGTIFSVTHGTKGSRVSVLEGEVVVEQGRRETVLSPGQQLVTRPGTGAVPLAREVAWSRNGDRYVGLLAELKALDEEIGRALASPDLRYSSRLLDLVPAGTTVYLALPNLSEEAFEMHRLFQERLAESAELRRWWEERVVPAGLDARVEDILGRVRQLGEHLGEEIVVALSVVPDGEEPRPLVLAEVEDPSAFAASLAAEVERVNAAGRSHVRLVADPATATAVDGELLLWQAGDLFAASPDAAALRDLASSLAGERRFADGEFRARLAEAYGQGAQWLAGVDLATLVAQRPASERDAEALRFSGLEDVRYLIVERKAEGEAVHTGAVLSFAGPRRAAAAWLSEPAPMGSLDFVSAEASVAAAFVVEDPEVMLGQVFGFLREQKAGFAEELAAFEREHGLDPVADLARPVGGEMAVALDGPVLPTPSWKLVLEVYDAARLQQAIERLLEALNEHRQGHGEPILTAGSETVGGRVYHRIAGTTPEIHYTFERGYLVAGPSRELVDRALQVRDSGYGLVDAPAFQSLLPRDGYLNFSALFFTHAGELGQKLLAAGPLTDEQRRTIDDLDLTAPSLTCAYGEADQVRLVSTSRGGLLGSRLATLLGLGTFKPPDPDV